MMFCVLVYDCAPDKILNPSITLSSLELSDINLEIAIKSW